MSFYDRHPGPKKPMVVLDRDTDLWRMWLPENDFWMECGDGPILGVLRSGRMIEDVAFVVEQMEES